MIRFGVSTHDYRPRQTTMLSLHALLLHAVHEGLGVCRIPAAYIAPLAEASAQPLRTLVQQYELRLVVHAPIVAPHRLEEWFATVIGFFAQLDAADAVIICHLPHLHRAERALFERLPAWIVHHLAVELTHQPAAELITQLSEYGVPVVFDTLHYDSQLPWPYHPIETMFLCMASWQGRRPLIHLSTQATGVGVRSTPPPRGQHSDVLAPMAAVWVVRSLIDAGHSSDIEIEADSGIIAYRHLNETLSRYIPDLTPSSTHRRKHAPNPAHPFGTIEATPR